MIEEAIALGFRRVEAGAQGEHKMARGYMPTLTRSAVYVADESFRAEIQRFLKREREQTYYVLAMLSMQNNPFVREPLEHLRSQGIEIRGRRIRLLHN